MGFDADLTACAALVEKADPVRFTAAMASPVPARAVLFPLYAFNVEVSRAPWVTQEPMIAEMRLQWWRDALEEIAKGGPVRRHEVVTPLSRVISPADAEILDRLVAARRWDIYKDAFEDAGHFRRYLDETAAGLMWVAARALGGTGGPGGGDAAETAVRGFGRAAGLARFLQAVPALEAAGRVPLVDGRAGAVAQLARDGLADMPPGGALRRCLAPSARAALAEGWLARTLLKQASRDPGRVAGGRLGTGPVRQRLLLWPWT